MGGGGNAPPSLMALYSNSLFFVSCTLLLFAAQNLYVTPYSAHYAQCALEKQQATMDLAGDNCADPVRRAHQEGYGMCAASDRLLRQWCWRVAFDRLAESTGPGRVLYAVTGVEMSGMSWLVLLPSLAAGLLLYLGSGASNLVMLYRWCTASGADLPTCNPSIASSGAMCTSVSPGQAAALAAYYNALSRQPPPPPPTTAVIEPEDKL